jgi:LGFP repeat-containing protein
MARTVLDETPSPAAADQAAKRASATTAGEPGAAFFGGVQPLRAKTGVGSSGTSPFGGVVHAGSSTTVDTSPPPVAMPMIEARNAINAKAAELGWAGPPADDVGPAGSGFLRSFLNADIYFSPHTGAHEVHGAIRDKYNTLGGAAGVLGLPLTDETGTPDGEGRFNHFEGGSIYWTERNGAAMVRGAIRHVWAAQGWETGPLGYPVQDEHRYVTPHPATDPSTAWSLFENGAIVTGGGGTAIARTVDVSPDTMRCLVRQEFDRVIHEASDEVGLHAPSEITAVSRSYPRAVTFVLHGFHKNPIVADTDFDATFGLQFGLVWQTGLLSEPETKSLAAALVPFSLSVSAQGPIGTPGPVARGIRDGIHDAFATPRTVGPPIPAGGQLAPLTPDIIDVLVTADGGLRVLLNPLPDFASGGLRVIATQAAVNALGC